MRNLFGGLLFALIIVVLVLFVAAFSALGVAVIGWLLQHWFDLTQWQGTLIALAVAGGLALLVYKLVAQPAAPIIWEGDLEDWQAGQERTEPAAEPPIVPWRRNRPAQGELPPQKPAPGGTRRRK